MTATRKPQGKPSKNRISSSASKSGIDLLRLNQAISKTGFASRRQADELIASGKVKVNGKICTDFATTINPRKDKLVVMGKELRLEPYTYIAMYKPRGIVTTCADESGRRSIIDCLPLQLRHLRPVGRLDKESEGLIILTNDGALTQRLTHPSHHVYKHYQVSVEGFVKEKELQQLADGIELEDGITQPAEVTLLDRNKELTIVGISIKEGRNRQLRRMFAQLGYPVKRLVRVGIGALQLGKMKAGSWRQLSAIELRQLD